MSLVLFGCILILIGFLIWVYTYFDFVSTVKTGINFLNKGDPYKAIYVSLDIIDSSRKYKRSIGYVLRGNCYLQMGMYNDAFNDLSNSIKIAQIPDMNIMAIGKVFCKFKEYNRALKYLSKATEFKPHSSTLNSAIGLIYYHTKEYDKAIETFNEAIRYNGNKKIISNIYSNLGATYIKMKKYNEAAENLSMALNINPKCSAAYRNYANLFRIKGNIPMAKDSVLKSIDLCAGECLSYKTLAEICLIDGNYVDFYENFKIFLKKKKMNIDYEEIEDNIYDKVKNDEAFKSLMKRTKENVLEFNDLDIFIDDDVLLSNKAYKKRGIIDTSINYFNLDMGNLYI